MTPFPLKIVTPAGMVYDGEAEMLTVTTTGGQVGILARHIDYVAALGNGKASVTASGLHKTASCRGGMVSVKNGSVTLIPSEFAWTTE